MNSTGMTVSFLLLIGIFLLDFPHVGVVHHQAQNIDKKDISTKALHNKLSDPPSVFLNSYYRDCRDCHSIFESQKNTAKDLMQHKDLVMNHGANDRCFNCHDKADRNLLRLNGEKTIGFSQSELLCAKCHGPSYRDWKKGIHGRANGYWDQDKGKKKLLSCVECHDPHQPAFGKMKPLPGPYQEHPSDYHSHFESPLMRYQKNNEKKPHE